MNNLIARLNETAKQMSRGDHGHSHIFAVKDAIKSLEQIDPRISVGGSREAEPGVGPGRIIEAILNGRKGEFMRKTTEGNTR